jgi:hypothetical protein
MRTTFPCLAGAALAAAATLAAAQDAAQVFQRVSHAVYYVVVTSSDDSVVDVIATGSAVLIAPGRVVTNCHVAGMGPRLFVTRGTEKVSARARVVHAAREFDLCELDIVEPGTGFDRPVEIAPADALAVGDPVFAIGAPMGMELTISSGIVSAFRQERKAHLVQITAPISHGSSGGGLFDRQGRLVGITTMGIVAGQNLNFAVSAQHIRSAGIAAADLEKDRAQARVTLEGESAFERRERLRRQEQSSLAARRKQIDSDLAAADRRAESATTPAAAASKPAPVPASATPPAPPPSPAQVEALLAPYEGSAKGPKRVYETLRKAGALAGLGGVEIANRVYLALIAEQVGAELRWRGEGNPVAEVQVQLRRNGDVMYLLPGKSSGVESFDREALRALGAASPFPVPRDNAAFEALRNFTLAITAPRK